MGPRLARRCDRQHPDLSSPPTGAHYRRVIVLTLLAIDGVLCAILAAFFLPTYIGTWPFPVSALIAGAVTDIDYTAAQGIAGFLFEHGTLTHVGDPDEEEEDERREIGPAMVDTEKPAT